MVRELLIERSEILENFGREELDDILQDQMDGLFHEVNGVAIDYYKPYYYKYKSMTEQVMDDDTRSFLEKEFRELSMTFIRKIESVFEFTLNEEWLALHSGDIPSITLLLYSFFVLELGQNIEDSIHRTLKLNSENLYSLFEDRKNKKDGSTNMYSKLSNPQMGVLLANIHDVTVQVISEMTEEEFLKNLPEGYVPGDFVRKMYEAGNIGDGFMEVIRKIFLNSSFLKSIICFNIESHYRSKD